jgi:hypothetical protein
LDKLVACLLATAALWVRIKTSLKNTKMGDISKGVSKTLKLAEKNTKKFCLPETSPRRGVTPEVFIDRLHPGPVLRLLTPAPELKGRGLAPETSGSDILAFLPVTPWDKTVKIFTLFVQFHGGLALTYGTYSTKFFDSFI